MKRLLTNGAVVPSQLGLRAGEVVEVRSLDEIHATHVGTGELDSLPFVPEMVRFFGQRLTVQSVFDSSRGLSLTCR